MKIKVFRECHTQYPEDLIICLSHYSSQDLSLLEEFVCNVTVKGFGDLTAQPFIEEAQCGLKFTVLPDGNGIAEQGADRYECRLPLSDYRLMNDIIKCANNDSTLNDPFRHYWLYDKNNPIELLLSPECLW